MDAVKYGFISWREITGVATPEDKIDRVYRKIREQQPSVECRWLQRVPELEEFKPDKLFLEPPPEGLPYPDCVMNYPCEKDFLENWADE